MPPLRQGKGLIEGRATLPRFRRILAGFAFFAAIRLAAPIVFRYFYATVLAARSWR